MKAKHPHSILELGGSEKKKHPPTSWSFFASQLDYPIIPWGVYGCLWFRVWFSKFIPLSWDCCNLQFVDLKLHFNLIPGGEASGSLSSGSPVNQPGPQTLVRSPEPQVTLQCPQIGDKFWRYLTKTRTSQNTWHHQHICCTSLYFEWYITPIYLWISI